MYVKTALIRMQTKITSKKKIHVYTLIYDLLVFVLLIIKSTMTVRQDAKWGNCRVTLIGPPKHEILRQYWVDADRPTSKTDFKRL